MALEAEQRADRRGRDAVLPCAGLGDDAPLAHARGEQRLPERVVDLVRAGVGEVLALEDDAGAARPCRQAPGLVERRRPDDVVAQQLRQLAVKCGILAHGEVGGGQLLDRRDQCLGHVAAAEGAVIPPRVGVPLSEGWSYGCSHVNYEWRMPNDESNPESNPESRITSKSARSLSGSLRPGADSTPDDTSIAAGRTVSMASVTLPGL